MPRFRRYHVPNALVFITTVTNGRLPVFRDDHNVTVLFETMHGVQELHPFHLLAYAILPDHLHFLMRTETSTDFSEVMQSIKRNMTWNYKKLHGMGDKITLWQGRFWDHIIRDENDLDHHIDYIHYNPVKHGLVTAPLEWEHSTYRYWMDRGYYDPGWGSQMPDDIRGMEFE